MHRLRHDLAMIFAMLLAIIALSCATTPKQKQLMTIDSFNSVYERYLNTYDQQNPVVQAEWKEKVDPLFKTASDAVKAYAKIKDPTSLTAQEKSEVYTQALNKAFEILLTYGVDIKEE